MTGEIGVLYQNGQQIGGFFDWEIRVDLVPSEGFGRDSWSSWKVNAKRTTAVNYWLLGKPNGSVFDAEFYQHINDQLILMDAGKVSMEFPEENAFNTKLLGLIEIIWMN